MSGNTGVSAADRRRLRRDIVSDLSVIPVTEVERVTDDLFTDLEAQLSEQDSIINEQSVVSVTIHAGDKMVTDNVRLHVSRKESIFE